MGELIHCGGAESTRLLARKAGVGAGTMMLDICSALGGPARLLAREFGADVTGLDATGRMVEEAIKRTANAGLSDRVRFRLGNALDIPFRRDTFDVVWGEDAWCYITDKERLIREAVRVLKPGGTLAFTDWVQTGDMSDEEMDALYGFMAFPYMETISGYAALMDANGLKVEEAEDLSEHFCECMRLYENDLQNRLRPMVVGHFGQELYDGAFAGVALWRKASEEGKVGRGRFIARKPN
jgi:ubiquinone/menaquinone biosynthesis C-methylase UbiE